MLMGLSAIAILVGEVAIGGYTGCLSNHCAN